MSTIPLAKGFKEDKLNFPVYLSYKYDGVPVRIDFTEDGWSTQTRQGKPMPSVEKIVQEFYEAVKGSVLLPITFVGEVTQRDDLYADFKDTSGIVRRQYDQSDKLLINLFECSSNAGHTFADRYTYMISEIGEELYYRGIRVATQFVVHSMEHLNAFVQTAHGHCNNLEGVVARNHDDPWAPGKRSWGYQKILNEPTIDLRIVGVEEAVNGNTGEGKGMAGRLIASYKGEHIGIGPGKLNHKERVELLKVHSTAPYGGTTPYSLPRMAQIKYKKDSSYDALRQPTFQHWRDDKSVPDA